METVCKSHQYHRRRCHRHMAVAMVLHMDPRWLTTKSWCFKCVSKRWYVCMRIKVRLLIHTETHTLKVYTRSSISLYCCCCCPFNYLAILAFAILIVLTLTLSSFIVAMRDPNNFQSQRIFFSDTPMWMTEFLSQKHGQLITMPDDNNVNGRERVWQEWKTKMNKMRFYYTRRWRWKIYDDDDNRSTTTNKKIIILAATTAAAVGTIKRGTQNFNRIEI